MTKRRLTQKAIDDNITRENAREVAKSFADRFYPEDKRAEGRIYHSFWEVSPGAVG